MKEIFGSREGPLVGHYRSILEQAGIPCFVRNEHAAALSELQGPAFYPILCVDDEWYEVAMETLLPYYQQAKQAEAELSAQEDWPCPGCGEMNPPGFEECWNCQQARPGTEQSAQS